MSRLTAALAGRAPRFACSLGSDTNASLGSAARAESQSIEPIRDGSVVANNHPVPSFAGTHRRGRHAPLNTPPASHYPAKAIDRPGLRLGPARPRVRPFGNRQTGHRTDRAPARRGMFPLNDGLPCCGGSLRPASVRPTTPTIEHGVFDFRVLRGRAGSALRTMNWQATPSAGISVRVRVKLGSWRVLYDEDDVRRPCPIVELTHDRLWPAASYNPPTDMNPWTQVRPAARSPPGDITDPDL